MVLIVKANFECRFYCRLRSQFATSNVHLRNIDSLQTHFFSPLAAFLHQ